MIDLYIGLKLQWETVNDAVAVDVVVDDDVDGKV